MKPGHTDRGHKGGKRSRGPLVGAALGLDKFANAKVSKYDKKQLLEKQRALRAKQINKYRKLQKRLAAEGKLPGPAADAATDGYKEPAHASTSGVTEAEELDSIIKQRHAPTAHEDAVVRPAKKQRTQQPNERAGQERQLPEPPNAADRPHPAQHKQPQQQQQQQRQQQEQQQQQDDLHEDAGASMVVQGRRKHKQPRPPSQLQRLADKRQRELMEQRQAHEQRLKAQEELKEKKQAKQKERSASKHNFFKRTKHGQPLMKYRVDKVLQVLQREVAGKP